eukprot:13499795-Alexandrium_andersonii.AAC.1
MCGRSPALGRRAKPSARRAQASTCCSHAFADEGHGDDRSALRRGSGCSLIQLGAGRRLGFGHGVVWGRSSSNP